MKSKYIILLVFTFIMATANTNAQVIVTKSDSIAVGQDSILKFIVSEYRGSIQWQKLDDDEIFVDIENETNDSLSVSPEKNIIYRAKISEGTCTPVYSDSVKIDYSLPNVLTDSASGISVNSASLGGVLLNDGGDSLTQRGICYSKLENPTLNENTFPMGAGEGSFKTSVGGLKPNTAYYARAFASNSNGTIYGKQIEFTTTDTFSNAQYVTIDQSYTIYAPDSSILKIPANSLSDDGEVTIAISGNEPTEVLNEDLEVVGQSYSLTIPGDTLYKSIEFSFLFPELSVPQENYSLFLFNGDSYYPIEYRINGDTITAIIDIIDWELSSNEKSAAFLFSTIAIIGLVDMQTPDESFMGLKEITFNNNGNIEYKEPTANNDSKILLMVHGWISDPTVWNSIIYKIKNEQDLEYTGLWTFGYNSSLSVEDNAAILIDALKNNSNGVKVDIVSHSMGGLVSRSMIEFQNGSEYVNKLITLGTPHLGSPLAVLRNILGAFVFLDNMGGLYLYNNSSQGFKDLQTNSNLINKLKTTQNPPVPYFLIAATNDPNQWVWSEERLLPGPDDGVVTVKSATGVPESTVASEINIPVGDAHNALLYEDKSYEQILEYLRLENSDDETKSGSFIDPRDGKPYDTVHIGDQIWMAENYAYDAGEGCWAYNNDESNIETYGRLYDWETAMEACPDEWRLPTIEDWLKLKEILEPMEGHKMKSKTGWYNGGNGNNESGFNAIPSGLWHEDFMFITKYAYFWSSTEVFNSAKAAGVEYDQPIMAIGWMGDNKTHRYAVRYIKE